MPYTYHNGMAALSSLPSMVSPSFFITFWGMLMFLFSFFFFLRREKTSSSSFYDYLRREIDVSPLSKKKKKLGGCWLLSISRVLLVYKPRGFFFSYIFYRGLVKYHPSLSTTPPFLTK
jgi:hypothetical protein